MLLRRFFLRDGQKLPIRATPKEIVDRIAAEISRAVADAVFAAQLSGYGFEPLGNRPEEFAAMINLNIAMWGEAVTIAGLKQPCRWQTHTGWSTPIMGKPELRLDWQDGAAYERFLSGADLWGDYLSNGYKLHRSGGGLMLDAGRGVHRSHSGSLCPGLVEDSSIGAARCLREIANLRPTRRIARWRRHVDRLQ